MKQVKYCLIIALVMVFLSGCVWNKLNEEKTVIVLKQASGGSNISIGLEKGPQWTHQVGGGPFTFNVLPQLVFWLENDQGTFIKTLYISGATGSYSNHAKKSKLDDEYFQQALPIWAGKIEKAGYLLPSSDKPYADAVTGATPQSSFDLNIQTETLPQAFKVCAEINKSTDYNDFYTEDRTDWVGQPSIIYCVDVEHPFEEKQFNLLPVGHSHISPDQPGLDPDMDHIDTALDIVNSITVSFD